MSVDALTVAVVWGRLAAIAEEMATALKNTAYSDQVREGGDFTTGVFDSNGELLAQANRAPAHLGAMPHAVRHMLGYYPAETLRAGDVVTMNDPHLGAGHLPDFFEMSPVFAGGELVGFVVGVIHATDVGGTYPGSQAIVGVTEAIQEGIRLLPILLYRGGQPNAEVFRILGANVRVPDLVLGDLRALRSALHVGAAGLTTLVERYGADTVADAAATFLDRSEAAVREELRKIPAGVYRFVDQLDDVGPGTEPVRLEVAITIDADGILFDFTGSSPQTRSSINSTLSYTRSYCYWVTKAITTEDLIPQNAGQLRPVRVVAPEGSFFNASPGAAVGGRACLNQRIVELLFGALASAVPEKVCAASGQWVNPIFSGHDPSTGGQFIFYDYVLGGIGGRAQRDGVDAMSPVFSVENVPIEIQEAQYPILVERFELMRDSGGAGRCRGGLSLRKDIRILADEMVLTNLTDRQRFRPYGLLGGADGSLGETILNPGEHEERIGSKDVRVLARGDVVSFRCSGSGGYGPPSERPYEAVSADVREGLVSVEQAALLYGWREEDASMDSPGR
ncbi:MAG: hydantoinase B/oxoprolinase family protein [Gaiellaceae bacterium]